MKLQRPLQVIAAILVVLLAGCTPGADDGTEPSEPAAETTVAVPEAAAPGEPAAEETETEPEAGGVVPVGGTFVAAFDGEFEFTYQGLLDLGTADGGEKGEISCLGIMVSATMTSLDDLFNEGSYLLPSTEVTDAAGTDISAIQTIGCPSSPYLEAGWTPVTGVDFPRDSIGTPVDQVLLGVVGVPVGEVGDAEAITFRVTSGQAALEFAITESL